MAVQEQAFVDLEKASAEDLSARERILKTAVDLFYHHGVHTVGIDRIVTESDVARMTFYKHFPSKTKLIVAYLRYKSEGWFRRLAEVTSDESIPPLERLLGIFNAVKEAINTQGFRGCAFIRGLSDFGADLDKDDPEVQECISAHFRKNERLVEELINQIQPRNVGRLTPLFVSLINGAIVVGQTTGNGEIADISKDAARKLLA